MEINSKSCRKTRNLAFPTELHQWPNMVNTFISIINGAIFILSGHTHDDDDEPHITKDVFFSCVRGHEVLFHFPFESIMEKPKF